MKIAIVVGTRPEIIKMSPIIRECQKRKIDFFILHSGQHYDHNMDEIFFEELELPAPKYNLHVGSKPFGQQVGMMMKGMKKNFIRERPGVVLVQGDTLTVLMGTLAAKKVGILVAHHEAGLRSHDLTMPEEVNRILTDHLSEFLFFPTKDAIKNVNTEGVNANYTSMTGNTIVDAVYQNSKIADRKCNILKKLNLKSKKYVLITVHRAENTNDKKRLQNILRGLEMVGEKFPEYKLLFPMHPRTSNKILEYNLKLPSNIRMIKPLGFLEFLQLEKNAVLCITDSGGLQEECSIMHVPTVTVRDNTERPETIKFGMNLLAGASPEKILECSTKMLTKKIIWRPLFGDGKASERIVDIIKKQVKNIHKKR
jgi:UDP-N-acetylglucosamine 2-epimerase (non-hydrolysing)